MYVHTHINIYIYIENARFIYVGKYREVREEYTLHTSHVEGGKVHMVVDSEN